MTDQVGNVLQEALDSRSNGEGTSAAVHSFGAGLDLDPFILRRQWQGQLEHTTHLYPVKQLVSGINVGQPLMQTGDGNIQILLRQPGQSIAQLWEQCRNADIWPERLMNEIDALTTAKGNPFVKIMEETYAVGELGYMADLKPGNLLIDQGAGCLRQVDQCVDPGFYMDCSWGESNLKRCRNDLSTVLIQMPMCSYLLNTQGKEVEKRLKGMIEEAYETVRARHAKNEHVPCVFADVSDVKAIALSDSTHVMAEKLRELSERANVGTSR